MINKFFSTPEEALKDVPDGATVMIGGFGNAGMPAQLIDCLIAQGAKDLTVVNNKVQSAVCMVLAAVIVSVSLSLGAFAAEHAAHDGYSVTVTQIQ